LPTSDMVESDISRPCHVKCWPILAYSFPMS